MKRLLIVAMFALSTISITGCANGPIRSLFRGASCGAENRCQCGATVTSYSPSSCNCGLSGTTYDYYDAPIIQGNTGTIPAPGPGQ